jgi:putative transposase
MLMSYTQGVNKQMNRTGSLFRQHSKINDGWDENIITSTSKNRELIFVPDNHYGAICFEYIHMNPVKAGLVSSPEEWAFSSAKDYKGLRSGTLCNQNLAKELKLY